MKTRIAALGLAFFMAFGLMLIGQSDAGLVGAWLFDENSGDAAGDFSGNGNDGMLMNGAGWTAGVRGSAVSFVGGGDPQFILFNADEDPAGAFILHSDSDVSMVLWVRPTEGGHGSWMWSRGDDADAGRFNVHNGPGDIFNFDYREDADKSPDPPHGGAAGIPTPIGEWTHVAITRVGNEYTFYGNGESVETWVDENPVLPSANGWILGSPRGCCPLKADIDELGFFDVALSQDQIAAVMGGVEALGAVEPSGKLATAWAQIKDRD